MGIEDRLAAIAARIDWLRSQDRATTVFGSTQHRYRAEPVLGEDELAGFEREHEISLPASYRAYLAAIGNGGVGPYYGLSPLAPLEREQLPSNYVVLRDGDGNVLGEAGTGPRPLPDVVSSLARPFQLTEDWSPDDGPLPVAPDTNPYDGCVHLAEQGCGYFDFLVVRGAAAGQVWSDYTAGGGPISKAHDDFADWYESWLDHAQLEWIEKNAADMAMYAPRNYPGIDDCVRLLDAALERSPGWADGWRARGYVALNRERYDDARANFETAAERGKKEAAARLQLDLARLAALRGDWDGVLEATARGLAENDLWASTRTSLRRSRLRAFDQLGDEEGALEALTDLAGGAYHRLDDHFELALRRLLRDEPDQAWAVLDQAVADNVGPNRHDTPATRASVYGGFADWLDEDDQPGLAERVRGQL